MARNGLLSSVVSALRYAVTSVLNPDCVRSTVAKMASDIEFDFSYYREVSDVCAINARLKDLDEIEAGILDLDVDLYDNFFDLVIRHSVKDGSVSSSVFDEYVHNFLCQLRKVYMFVLNVHNFGVNDIRISCKLRISDKITETEYLLFDYGESFLVESDTENTLTKAICRLYFEKGKAEEWGFLYGQQDN